MTHTPPALLELQLAAQRKRGELPAAIFTDLDGTFVVEGGDAAKAAAEAVFQRAQTADWPLIAVSGRSTFRVTGEVQRGELPPFSAIVAAVGTEISLWQGGRYVPDMQYAARLAPLYEQKEVEQLSRQVAATLPKKYGVYQHKKPVVEPFKMSFRFEAPTAKDIVTVMEPFQQAFPQLKLILCEDLWYNLAHKGEPKHYNIDIVPASKSDAIKYLMEKHGIGRGIMAGDSGNDIDALLVPGLIAVLVGGHLPEAHDALRREYPGAPLGTWHQHGDKHLYIDTHPARLGPESILLAMDYLRQH
jgi:HAD superfamily hydrolase (TIGR01484 family)